MLAFFGRIDNGLRRSNRTAAFSTSAPVRSSRTAVRQLLSTSSSRVRQSGAGTTSSSISHIGVEALVVGRLEAQVEAARAADVLGGVDRHQVGVGGALEHLAGVVGAGVVDDDDAVGAAVQRVQTGQHPLEEVGAVVGHHHDGNGLRHDRYLSWPEKSPRRPAYAARALIAIRPGLRLGGQVEPDGLQPEQQHVRPAAVLAEVERVVAGHAVVLEVARRVVVRRPPEHHRRAEIADRRMVDDGVDDGRDPGAGGLGAEPVLVVVAPDEELGTGIADPLDQRAGHQHAVERDDDVVEPAVGGRRPCRRDVVHHPGAARQPDREDQAVGVAFVDDERPPEVEVRSRPAAARGSRARAGRRRPSARPGRRRTPRPPSAALRGSRRPRRGCGRACGGRRPAPASHSPVPSVEALSTTRTAVSRSTSRRRATRRCSRGRRL